MQKSDTSERVYEFIVEFMKNNLYAPSVKEIGEGVGLTSNATVFYHLHRLELNGLIYMQENRPRTIKLIGYKLIKEQGD